MRSIPSDFCCDESKFSGSTFSVEKVVKDFASDASVFSGDALIDDGSTPEEVLFDLFDFAGDGFEGLANDDAFLAGDFLVTTVLDGESF